MIPPRPLSWLLLLLLFTFCPSCAKVNHLMKAKPATPATGFLNFDATPDNQTARSPFHYAAYTTNPTILAGASQSTQIYISPVLTQSLRPISKKLAAAEYTPLRPQQTREIAGNIRTEFARALTNNPGAPYQLALRPRRDTLILYLNLIELDPTSAKGNVAKTVVEYTVGPIASFGVGLFTGGRIAVEGSLRDGATGAIIFQFADREKDKATLYSARDYMALGHSTRTILEWAEQLATFLRTPSGQVKDSFFLTPMVY